MAVLQDININVHGQPSEKRLQTFLRLSQNENGRMINFRVLGPPLPSNCTATFSGTKPDGNVYSKTGTVTGNFVVIEEDIQMTAVAGVWDAKLDIINGTHNIMTALIRVVVDADVVDPDAIASDSQLQGLVAEAKYYAEHARTDAYGSPLTAPTKAQMTDHTRVYVYTGSEPNMVAGNWYLWNGSAWVSGGVYNAVAVQTDTTLSVAGKAADGKAAGDAIEELKEDLNNIEPGLSEDAKIALLNCFQHVAWIDEHGQDYYDALEDALYATGKTLISITAIFDQGQNVIYTDDSLDTLKQYLTIIATYDDSSTSAVTAYTLSGTLTVGTNTIIVSYGGKTTTFYVNVVKGVPQGYSRLNYVETDGNQYVNIGLNETQVASAKYKMMLTSDTSAGDGKHILSSSKMYFPLFKINAGVKQVFGNRFGSDYGNAYEWVLNEIYSLDAFYTSENSFYVNNELIRSDTPTGSTFSQSNTFALFTYGGNVNTTRYRFYGRLYEMQIFDSTKNMLMNLLPAKNNSNIVGLYDTVHDTFYTSNSGVDLIAGEVA